MSRLDRVHQLDGDKAVEADRYWINPSSIDEKRGVAIFEKEICDGGLWSVAVPDRFITSQTTVSVDVEGATEFPKGKVEISPEELKHTQNTSDPMLLCCFGVSGGRSEITSTSNDVILNLHLWDFETFPTDLKEKVWDVSESGSSISRALGRKLRTAGREGEIRRLSEDIKVLVYSGERQLESRYVRGISQIKIPRSATKNTIRLILEGAKFFVSYGWCSAYEMRIDPSEWSHPPFHTTILAK